MKNFYFKFLISFLTIPIFSTSFYATHIIGGDFKVTMTNNGANSSVYDIQLRLYRDDVNGAVNMPASVTIGIYQIGTNNLQTTKILNLNGGSGTIVPLGDPCYTPNPSIVRIEEGVYNTVSVILPNFSMGYYLHYETCCRNGLIDNLATPTSDGISIFAIIPDPAIGQNSTPDFGDYPNDAYFCVNNIKYFTWPVTDPDGDSLVFSLVAPLNDGINSNNGNSAPGSGAYPFYPSCNFAAGYNQFNVIGGTPQMSINPVTGEIAASPAILGYFQFSVRVEEYRNGVKIGEVRRDAQYTSLPCVLANPPVISLNNDVGSPAVDTFSIDVYVNDSICFDFEVGVNDPSDSVFLKVTSSNFDLFGSYVDPSNYISGGTNLAFYDWNNNIGDTVFFNQFTPPNSAGFIGNTGVIYMRYCWEAPCEGIDSTYNLTIDSYSIDCSGFNPVQKELSVNVQKIPAPTFLDIPSTINVTLDDTICIDLFAQDTLNSDDTLAIEPYSGNFSLGSTFIPPLYNNSTGQYYYEDFNDSIGNTISMLGYSHVGNVSSAIQNVALRFCWVTDCNYVYQKEFDLNYRAFSTVCGSDTVMASSKVTVDPPTGDVKEIPNIFSPNGDGTNDIYKLAGKNDPCYDVMQINIYNRWGQLVFNSIDSNFEWDGKTESGKLCKPGAYLVIMDGTFGSTYDADGVRTSNPVRDEFWIHLVR